MRNRSEEFRRKIQQFMIGRYGMDEFSLYLSRVAVIIAFVSIIPRVRYLALLAWTLVVISVYRCFSKKITARSRERDWYLKQIRGLKSYFGV